MIIEIISAVFLFLGSVFFLIAAIGAFRFPDLYTRMHAATKGGAFAAVLMLSGIALYFQDVWVGLEALLVIVFVFLTAPIAGHVIGRAAHTLDSPVASETVVDELRDAEEREDARLRGNTGVTDDAGAREQSQTSGSR
jgi:multicomponent Na+:H+ antiporter subunit G